MVIASPCAPSVHLLSGGARRRLEPQLARSRRTVKRRRLPERGTVVARRGLASQDGAGRPGQTSAAPGARRFSAMADGSKHPVCAVVGVGPGNGEAIARRFAANGYAIALMARRTELTAKLAAELPRAKAYACDVAEAASVEAAFAAMRADLGEVDALIYNA